MIAEFPTTFEAAEASRKHGMNVLMGAPNIVRGGSHSGNVAASELAQLGLLDIPLPTTTPPACSMRHFASPMTRATALRCRRR